ncbi:Protein fmp52, mitochondrial [Ciborinia camelliae]|nr:Protein fmp52, mitochondrial [Ciborinia camelliae]
MTSTTIVGSTGLVGSHVLSALLSHPKISSIHAISRRDPTTPSPKLHAHTSADTTTWSSLLTSISPTPTLFFSSLGTTRGLAGSVEAQRKVDYDLNLSLATTYAQISSSAPEGTKTNIYILISTTGANSDSVLAYPRMKGELEDAVKKLQDSFKHIIILRPGLIVGWRRDSRPPEYMMRQVAGFAGWLSPRMKDFWAQDAGVIGKAAVNAALRALKGTDNGEPIPKVWELGQSDVVRLGRTEWVDEGISEGVGEGMSEGRRREGDVGGLFD